jgi:phospholipid/cholesterol/gamma-HCH transport system ATP-binding protein
MTAPIIAVRDLEVRLGRRTILQGLDLDVKQGEILTIVGGSGSGKTSLLRQMLMLAQPSGGEVLLFGHSTRALKPVDARILWTRMGATFQHGALFTSLTVLENVCLPIHEHARLSARLIRELGLLKIQLAGLPASAASQYPDELSGGMIKRAALARALALDPELLFLDEPTSGLDPVGAAAFDELILRLKRLLNLTIVMITHDPDSIWRTASRVAFLGEGRVLALGPAAEVANNPHPEIQRYFSGPRMLQARERTWKAE